MAMVGAAVVTDATVVVVVVNKGMEETTVNGKSESKESQRVEPEVFPYTVS